MEEWQLTSQGETVSMKTRWPGDYSSWRIIDQEGAHIFAVDNVNRPEEWQLKYDKTRTFQVYTEFEGEIQSWLVYQEGKRLSPATQVAMTFLTILSTAPKF